MLILTRTRGESIIIGDDITVTYLESYGQKARIGISAPKNISIDRAEIREKIIKSGMGYELD